MMSQRKTNKQETPAPFYIVRDYRKTLRLRKQRQMRKSKLLKEKLVQREAAREQKLTRIQTINRSMLEEDQVWHLVNDQPSIEDCPTNIVDPQSEIDRKIQRLRWEVLFTLPTVIKETLYCQQFAGFEYSC